LLVPTFAQLFCDVPDRGSVQINVRDGDVVYVHHPSFPSSDVPERRGVDGVTSSGHRVDK
jgi:hypothetical protein